jgi:PEP-CTERM motif
LSDPKVGRPVRRRRSWYRRRIRNRRILVASVCLLAIAVLCWQSAARFFPLPTLNVARALPDSFWARATREQLGWTPAHPEVKHALYVERIPGVYPYSVIPGGVRSPERLRAMAGVDHAVARHFSQFDYGKAHLVRLSEAKDVFVSYRIRDTIFWTRKRIRLQPGELLLTDGNITARARCGNQISETAKPEVSNEEPEEDVLDQPVALEPMGPSLPIHPVLHPPDLPAGVPLAPTVFAGGFSFPYAPFAGGAPIAACVDKDGQLDRRCKPHKHPVVPEPSTIVLLASGAALILWRYRLVAKPVKA